MTDDDPGGDDRDAWTRPGAEPVGPGVHRIPLPLPGDGLKAVNVYAIAQPDGLVLIDSGWAIARARTDLEDALASLDAELGDVRTCLVTHIHRDHVELAIHLRREFGSALALGIGEQPSLELLLGDDEAGGRPMLSRLQRAGAEPLIRLLEQVLGPGDGGIVWELPDQWLEPTQVLHLADRDLEVVATPGHTRGHVCFLDRSGGVLFSGDHILPHITPSIGFEKLPARSPLADYLASLALVRGLPDTRMLPAHGPVRPTTHDRIDALVAHHDHRLKLSAAAVADGASTAYEVARALGWTRRERHYDELDPFNQMLAVNETAAHLDVLAERGELGVTADADGTARYHA